MTHPEEMMSLNRISTIDKKDLNKQDNTFFSIICNDIKYAN